MISRFIAPFAWGIFLAFATLPPVMAQAVPEAIRLTHVHGLFFSADGARLGIPGHRGVAAFEGSRWTRVPGSRSDFAGFSAARSVWFASGHPGIASRTTDVLGLGRSTDCGKTWQTIGSAGQSDFHQLAAGYRSGVLYLFNPSVNAVMPQAGLYRSSDLGARWHRAAAIGLAGEIARIAVHPDDASTVTVGTSDGLYVSYDGGETFVRLNSQQGVFSVAIAPSGDAIWYGTYDTRARLLMTSLVSQGAAREVNLPALHGDSIAFIAFNPVATDEAAIATARRNVFISRNKGKDWIQIAHEGDING